MKTLFAIPIYLRSEQEYLNDEKKGKKKAATQAKLLNRENDYQWPPWEFNGIIGYLQIYIDTAGRFRFSVLSINHTKGLKKIRKNSKNFGVMWALDYKDYYDQDIIKKSEGRHLRLNDSSAAIKLALTDFLRQMGQKTKEQGKYINVEHWLIMAACFDYKKYQLEAAL